MSEELATGMEDIMRKMMMVGGARPARKPIIHKSCTGYVNRAGARIAREDWAHHQKDSAYCTVKDFDNGEVYVFIEWHGRVDNIADSYQDMWKVFKMRVYNYNDQGSRVADPVSDSKWFPTEAKAIEAYEKFLSRWTKCELLEDGFVEVGNDLTPPPPPPPPNPDAPGSTVANVKLGVEDDGVGAW